MVEMCPSTTASSCDQHLNVLQHNVQTSVKDMEQSIARKFEGLRSVMEQLTVQPPGPSVEQIQAVMGNSLKMLSTNLEAVLGRKIEALRTAVESELDQRSNDMQALKSNFGTELASMNARNTEVATGVRELMTMTDEELRRLHKVIMDQGSAGHERIHMSAGKVVELHRTVELGLDRIMRAIQDSNAAACMTLGTPRRTSESGVKMPGGVEGAPSSLPSELARATSASNRGFREALASSAANYHEGNSGGRNTTAAFPNVSVTQGQNEYQDRSPASFGPGAPQAFPGAGPGRY
jgi:hypothetical protein